MEESNSSPFSLIADFDGNEELLSNIPVDENMPVLPLRNMVLFTHVVLPVSVGRITSLRLITDAYKNDRFIAVVCQKNPETENPGMDDLYATGTVAKVLRILEMPDQSTTVILQGMRKVKLLEITENRPYLQGHVQPEDELLPEKDTPKYKEFEALTEACKDLTIRYIKTSDTMRPENVFAVKNINNRMFLINFICTNLPLNKEEKMQLLEMPSFSNRAYKLLEILNREVQLAEIKASIQMRTREDIDQQQREYFLQQQIKNIPAKNRKLKKCVKKARK